MTVQVRERHKLLPMVLDPTMTVDTVRVKVGAHPASTPFVDGKAVTGDQRIGQAQEVEFVQPALRKG